MASKEKTPSLTSLAWSTGQFQHNYLWNNELLFNVKEKKKTSIKQW